MNTEAENKIDKLQKSIEQVLFYLHSDPHTNRKGLVEELDVMKRTIDDIIIRDKVFKAKASVWGAVGATILTVIWKIAGMLIPSLK